MSDTLSLDIRASIDWLFEEALGLSTVSDNAKLAYSRSLSDGLGAGQADKIWHAVRTIAANENDDLVLSALEVPFHDDTLVISLAKLKAVLILNLSTVEGEDLVLDSSVPSALVGPFHGSVASKIEIPADCPLLLVNKGAGWPVVASSGDVIRISNVGEGDISYQVVLVGTSS